MGGDIDKDLASFEAAVRSGAGPEAEQVVYHCIHVLIFPSMCILLAYGPVSACAISEKTVRKVFYVPLLLLSRRGFPISSP
jgi:hypothetical protein